MKNRVQKAYLIRGEEVSRVLVNADTNDVLIERMGRFEPHSGQIVKVDGETFGIWSLVPAAWLGFQPYWS